MSKLGRHATYICDGGPHALHVPYPDCSNAAQHTSCPIGYGAWHEWAVEISRTHTQAKCPDCGYVVIYIPKKSKR